MKVTNYSLIVSRQECRRIFKYSYSKVQTFLAILTKVKLSLVYNEFILLSKMLE